MPTVVDEAVDYARLGWHLLPGIPDKKRPYLKWHEASCDETAVVKMFEQFPLAEILVLCGPSNLAVLDVDIYKAPLEVRLPHYDTWTAETPRGGRQYVFAAPDGGIPTTAGRINDWTDTRGVGGLIVAPSVNSPKRKWVKRIASKVPVWPSNEFPGLGSPMVRAESHTSLEDGTEVLWTPVDTIGFRLPNERCPGSSHKNGDRIPSLGIRQLSNGTIIAECFAGCDSEEVITLLIDSGRCTAEDLGLGGEPKLAEPTLGGLFLTRDDLMALEPPEWLIDPYIQENALIQLTAKFNTGKTFVAVNWSLELASQNKRVLYIALEGLTGLKKRVTAWEEYYATPSGPILFSPRGYNLNLLSDRSVEGLVRDIESYGGFDLVVVDNLGEAMPGDENDSETVARSMSSLNQIRRAAGGAVLDLHNSGHGSTVRARGHSKMLDVHDTVIYLEAIEGTINGLKVVSGKERNAERFVTRRAQLVSKGGSLVAVLGGKAVAESDPTYKAIKLGHDTVNKIAKHLDIHYNTARDRVTKLLAAGDLVEYPVQGNEKRYMTMWDQQA